MFDLGFEPSLTPPPEQLPEVVDYCDCCGNPIYEGDDYFDLCGAVYCEPCVSSSRRVASL